ncbi:MAG: stage II sporulation protein M [Nanoarchaeota archaeon]|nr:stage II sporulation protein M [Nanoarchaeota archaeon]
MLEMIINPKNTEKGAWKMLFIGLLYGSLALLLTHWFFSGDPAFSKAPGLVVVIFCVMFSLPYMYFIIKREEEEDERIEGFLSVWRMHKDAVYALMWLFLGFVIAMSFWHIVLQDSNLLNLQIDTYCRINSPDDVAGCVQRYTSSQGTITGGSVSGLDRTLSILENNIYVMIFTLLFSLIFGAGAIFVLVWNASVIAAAIGIFTKYQLGDIPFGLARYMIHGFPEIAAYFITALAGGIFGVGVIRNGVRNKRFLRVLENTVVLLFIAIIILVAAALLEVYVTPLLF